VQIRHTVDVKADTIVPALRTHLDAHGLGVVQIVQVTLLGVLSPTNPARYGASEDEVAAVSPVNHLS
jgi:hypothetical protein